MMGKETHLPSSRQEEHPRPPSSPVLGVAEGGAGGAAAARPAPCGGKVCKGGDSDGKVAHARMLSAREHAD